MTTISLDDFNDLVSGTLEIELTEEPTEISEELYNLAASLDAKIKSVKFRSEKWEDNNFVKLTKGELASVVDIPSIIKIGSRGGSITVKAKDGKHFTVQELIRAIEKSEKKTRGNTEWFGGIDVHHVFFEGIVLDGNGYTVRWGS